MITMRDTARLAQVVSDGYGDKTVEVLTNIACLFLQSTSSIHSPNVDIKESDAHVYLDIEDTVIKGKGYRIEGMYLIIDPLGGTDDDSWYKITRVVVGQRKLLTNEVDNVHAFLRRVAKLETLNVS